MISGTISPDFSAENDLYEFQDYPPPDVCFVIYFKLFCDFKLFQVLFIFFILWWGIYILLKYSQFDDGGYGGYGEDYSPQGSKNSTARMTTAAYVYLIC